jgi:drug/metabolite transporter (DMT)-like permease
VFGLIASLALLGERLDILEWIGVGVVAIAIMSILRLPARGSGNMPA